VGIKYHLDEHIAGAVASGLRLRCIDVTTTLDQGLGGASDLRQREHATSCGRIFVTCDSDFVAIAAAGKAHAGIVFWSAKKRSVGQLVLDLVLLARIATADDMTNGIELL